MEKILRTNQIIFKIIKNNNYFFKYKEKCYCLKHIKWDKNISCDLLFKFKGELSCFKDIIVIGIICTNNNISKHALIELNNFSELTICSVKDLIKCIKKCHKIY